MSCNFTSKYVQHIPEMEFIQGDYIIIPFQFTDKYGRVIIPGEDDEVRWVLSEYESEEYVLKYTNKDNADGFTKSIDIDENTGVMYVYIPNTDSEKCYAGKYIQQPILIYNNMTFLRATGSIVFYKKVGGNND